MSEIKEKTVKELEAEFAEVMGCTAITEVTHGVPANNAPEWDETEVMRRAEKFAHGMREAMTQLFG
ncbi:hypothetical protein FACS189454_05880 [Planctomycetales bacterium]|nr:hypothetical protein FACS189454_05880 [Planctomycetales bacterium]